jgi:uncharacterized protein (TIGR00297 family)
MASLFLIYLLLLHSALEPYAYILCPILPRNNRSFQGKLRQLSASPSSGRSLLSLKHHHIMLRPAVPVNFDSLQIQSPTSGIITNLLLSFCLFIMKTKSLTMTGLLHATFLGIGLWSTIGFSGWLYCVAYFILGSLVTKVKMKEKIMLSIAEKREGARGPENVWGSAAIAMLCALMSYITPDTHVKALYKLAYVSSISTKLSDTFGSEIGKAYGKNCYLVTSLKKVPRGSEGAVSLEGTIAGIIGSFVMAALGQYLGLINGTRQLISVIIASFVATTIESIIGASFQQGQYVWLTNELVNLINTLIGALVGVSLQNIFDRHKNLRWRSLTTFEGCIMF